MNQPVFQPVLQDLYWHVLNASRIATRSHGCWWMLMGWWGVQERPMMEGINTLQGRKDARAARFAGQMIPMNCNSSRHDRYGNGHEWPWIKSIKVIVCYSADFWNLLGYFWVISGNFGNLLAVHFAAKLARSLLGRDQWPVASELVTHFHPRQRSNGCLMQVLLEVVIHNMCIYIIYI